MHEHPGGKFALQQNIGRDISKFFNGGYSLEIHFDAYGQYGYGPGFENSAPMSLNRFRYAPNPFRTQTNFQFPNVCKKISS